MRLLLARSLTFIFDDPELTIRLPVARVVLGSACAVLLAFGPYDRFFVDTAPYLYPVRGALLPPPGEWFAGLRAVGIVSSVAFALGLLTRASCVVTACSFGLVTFYAAQFADRPWSYNTHLLFFLLMFCCVETPREWGVSGDASPASLRNAESQSFLLFFMRLFVGMIYFQAGLAKLLESGSGWFLSGQTAWSMTALQGTALGKELCRFPWMFPLGSIATGFFELSFLFFFPFRRIYGWLTFAALGFHFMLWATLGISFWHVAVFVPALFGPVRWRTRAA